MYAFIDELRNAFAVVPICEVLQVAPSIATLNWVSWFNHHRLMAGLGYIPPAEAEANHYRQLTGQPASQS